MGPEPLHGHVLRRRHEGQLRAGDRRQRHRHDGRQARHARLHRRPGHADELTEALRRRRAPRRPGGIVDYVVGASPAPASSCSARIDDPRQRHYLNLYKLGEGPLYCFYTPYHLCHFEVPTTIARAVLLRRCRDRAARARPRVEVVAIAKRDLKAGEVIDGARRLHGLRRVPRTRRSPRRDGLLPIGVAVGCTLKRDIPKDAALTYADVDVPAGRLADELRREQTALLRGGRGGPLNTSHVPAQLPAVTTSQLPDSTTDPAAGRKRISITRLVEARLPGWINIFIFALADAFMNDGHEVTIVATTVGDRSRIERLFDVRTWPTLVSVESGPTRFSFEGLTSGWLLRGVDVIRRHRPDLVINNGALPFRVPGRSCNLAHDLGWSTSRRLDPLRGPYKRFAYGRCDHVVALSSEVRLGLARQLRKPTDAVMLIPPCVDLEAACASVGAYCEEAILHKARTRTRILPRPSGRSPRSGATRRSCTSRAPSPTSCGSWWPAFRSRRDRGSPCSANYPPSSCERFSDLSGLLHSRPAIRCRRHRRRLLRRSPLARRSRDPRRSARTSWPTAGTALLAATTRSWPLPSDG